MELFNLMRFCYNNRTNNFTKRNKKTAFIQRFFFKPFWCSIYLFLIISKLDRVSVVFSIFCIGNLSLSKYSKCCQCPLCMSSALIISTHAHWRFSTSRTCDILTDDFLWQLEQVCIPRADQEWQRLMHIV